MRVRLNFLVACLALVGSQFAISAMQGPPAAPPPATPQAPGAPGQAPARRGGGPPPAIAPVGKPLATVDLMTAEGLSVFGAQWKMMDVKIVEAPAGFTQGPSKVHPSYKSTYDIEPHANVEKFDDSSWPTVEPQVLTEHRGGGRVAFIWYRTNLTLPAMVGTANVAGRRAVLVVNVDDYAEVWVNGQLPRAVGLPSPATVQGFNMPQRILLADNTAKPGDRLEVAIFGINGPISLAPANGLFVREARIEFY
jgi:hypothetical protein